MLRLERSEVLSFLVELSLQKSFCYTFCGGIMQSRVKTTFLFLAIFSTTQPVGLERVASFQADQRGRYVVAALLTAVGAAVIGLTTSRKKGVRAQGRLAVGVSSELIKQQRKRRIAGLVSGLVLLCVGAGLAAHSALKKQWYDSRYSLETKGAAIACYIANEAALAKGDAEIFVVLHGGPGLTSSSMGPHFNFLKKKGAVAFFDQRGAGRSTMPPEAGAEQVSAETYGWRCVEDLNALVQAVGGGRPVTIIAHSWGCTIAARYAFNHYKTVERLILIGTPGLDTDHLRTLEAPATPFDVLRRAGIKDFVSAARLFGKLNTKVPDNFDLYAIAPSISAKALILCGQQDSLLPASQALDPCLRDSTLHVLSACGHWPFIEKPRETRQLIEEFLDTKDERISAQ